MAKKKPLTMANLNRVAKGDSGQTEAIYNSNNSNEYLLELQGRQGSLNYHKMSKQDAQTGMILTIYKNPIKSCNWDIQIPDDAEEQEIKAGEVLKAWLFEKNNISFETLLGQVLSFLEYGFSAFEIVWETMEYDGTVYLVPDLQQRLQTSIENIYPEKGVIQQVTVKGGMVDIPFDDMIFFVLNQQGSDLRGNSLLRNAYSNWKKRNNFYELLGIGIQRSSTGVPSMEVPEGTDIESADYIATEQLLKNITSHENAYMITKAGFKFDIKTFTFDSEKIQKVIDSLDEKNAVSVLTQFILLGTGGGGGAYALSRDQSDMFLDGLNYIVKYIESVFNREVIQKFLVYNFGETVDVEKVQLKGLNLNKKAGVELATTLGQLSAQGFIKATLDDEKLLRSFLELPELSEEEIEKRNNKETQPAPTPNQTDDDDDQTTDDGQPVKFAEQKTKSRIEIIEFEQGQLKDVMRANLLMIKDKLVADIKNTLNTGAIEIKGLKNIDVSWSKYATNLERKLAGIANLGWNKAKTTTKANNIKLSESIDLSKLDNKELIQYVKNHAQSIAEDQVTAMKINAILTASNGPVKGYSINQTMANVEKTIEAFIEGNKVAVGASLAVVDGVNFGEMQFYKEIKEQLWGYLFVGIDDDVQSEICRWYNGKTFSVDSTELATATPPLHPNCYDDKTEIYTKNGWELFKNVRENNLCLTLNPETKDLEWSTIKKHFSYDYSGDMIHFSNNQKSFDLLVTPDHTHFYYKRVDGGKKGREIKPIFSNFEQLKKTNGEVNFYLSSEWKGRNKNTININGLFLRIDDYCKFMGYYLSEGSIRYDYAMIAQEKYHFQMFDDIKRMGFKNVTSTKGLISVWDKRIGKYLKQFGFSNKKFIPDVIKNLPSEKIRIFLDAYCLGDGSRVRGKNYKEANFNDSLSYFTSSKRMADDLGELIIKAGKSVSYRIYKCEGKKNKFKNGTYKINHNIWVINELSSRYRKPLKINKEKYSGLVYDVEVENNHTILVRRNGRVVWGSNCRSYLEPIYKSVEETKPKIDDVVAPPSVMQGKSVF